MNWQRVVLMSGILLVGVLVGRWSKPSTTVDQPDQVGQSPVGSSTTDSSVRSLTRSRDRGDSSAEISQEGIVVTPERLYSLAEFSKIQPSGEEFLESDDQLIEVLDLSDGDLDSVQRRWAQGVEKLREAEASTVKVDTRGGVVELKVDALVSVRENLRSEFQQGIIDALGSERGQILLAYRGGPELFGGPGQERQYRITVEESDERELRIEEKVGDQQRIWISDEIPVDLRHLTKNVEIGQ